MSDDLDLDDIVIRIPPTSTGPTLEDATELRQRIAELEAAIATLTAERDALAGARWEPLADTWYDLLAPGRGQATRVVIREDGKAIQINSELYPSLWLPDNIRLCRLVPASEG